MTNIRLPIQQEACYCCLQAGGESCPVRAKTPFRLPKHLIRFYYFSIPKKLSYFLPAYSDIRKFVIIPIPTNPAF